MLKGYFTPFGSDAMESAEYLQYRMTGTRIKIGWFVWWLAVLEIVSKTTDKFEVADFMYPKTLRPLDRENIKISQAP